MRIEIAKLTTEENLHLTAKEVLFGASFGIPYVLEGTPSDVGRLLCAMGQRLLKVDEAVRKEGYEPAVVKLNIHTVL